MTNTIEDLHQVLIAFRDSRDAAWLIKRHRFITPAPFRQPQLQSAATAA